MNAIDIFLFLAVIVIYLVRIKVDKSDSKNLDRLARIKNASLVFQTLTWLSLIAGIYYFLAFLFGWPALIGDKIRAVTSPSHMYESPGQMPTTILVLWIGKSCLMLFGVGVLLRLFQLYGDGILFSAKNVTCVRLLGWWLIINYVIDHQLQSLANDMNLSTTPFFIGLLIIFVAWIMDEGRKIQEEQELTV